MKISLFREYEMTRATPRQSYYRSLITREAVEDDDDERASAPNARLLKTPICLKKCIIYQLSMRALHLIPLYHYTC